jgi:outer membrane protein assembly factor BamB
MYMSSPVLSGDSIFGMAHRRKGQYFCLDSGTGEILWSSEGLEGDYTSFVLAGPVLLLLTRDAQLKVVRNTREAFEVLAEYEVADSQTWAHLVVQGKQLLVKDSNSLASFTW